MITADRGHYDSVDKRPQKSTGMIGLEAKTFGLGLETVSLSLAVRGLHLGLATQDHGLELET